MMRAMLIASLHTQLPDGEPAPGWVHLLPLGTFRGGDGRGPYHVADAAALAATSMQAQRLVLDENHATDHSLRTGGAAPARGWIVAMEARADGVWGQVEWTRAGHEMMAERSYRGISPVFQHDKATGRVLRVLRAALTNAPNLDALTALHTQQDDTMDLPALRAALGLPDTADEAAILAAAAASRTAQAAHSQQIGRIATAVGAAPDAGVDAVLTALQTRTEAATDAGRMAGELVALQSQITTMQLEAARERAIVVLDRAAVDGKPIPATLREHYIARHTREPAIVEQEIAGMPSLHTGGFGLRSIVPPAGAGAAGLTPDESSLVAMMGLDPAAFAKTKQAGLASTAGGVG